jgi:threonine dehydratase
MIPPPSEILTAYTRIKRYVRRTPVIRVDAADFGITLDTPLVFKLEFLQHSGSFKPRGAFNNLLSRKVPQAGVAAASGGNHGAAVAYAAQRLGHKATIFVPDVSSPVKIARIKSYGADARVGGARYADALEQCDAFVAKSGALSVHAYDALETIAGQGTVGLEWQEDAPDLDTMLVAVGGGGLIAGIAAWFARGVKVVGVEPEGSRALHASLEAGRPVDVTVESVAADSLGARNTGQLVYDIA